MIDLATHCALPALLMMQRRGGVQRTASHLLRHLVDLSPGSFQHLVPRGQGRVHLFRQCAEEEDSPGLRSALQRLPTGQAVYEQGLAFSGTH